MNDKLGFQYSVLLVKFLYRPTNPRYSKKLGLNFQKWHVVYLMVIKRHAERHTLLNI